MWFNKGDQNSLESGLKSPKGHELCRRLHPNDSRNPFSFTVVPQGVMVWRRAAPKAQDGSTRRCERLCEAISLPPVIPTEVEGALLYGGGFAAFFYWGDARK